MVASGFWKGLNRHRLENFAGAKAKRRLKQGNLRIVTVKSAGRIVIKVRFLRFIIATVGSKKA
jgi:hypothetical protein